MKLVREYINEKFTEESNPIRDLGIGEDYLWKNLKEGDVLEIIKDDSYLIKGYLQHINAIRYTPRCYLCIYMEFTIFKNKEDLLENKEISTSSSSYSYDYLKSTYEIFRFHGKELKESLNEIFTEDSDPIHDMGIGLEPLIKKWLEEMGIKDYEINTDLSIDVNGSVDLESKGLKKLPSYIKFNNIKGFFTVEYNKLTSLRGCPEKTSGFFSCDGNKLTSLKYAPKKIGGTFNCSHNHISKIDKLPKGIKIRIEVNDNATKFTQHQIKKLLKDYDLKNNYEILIKV